MKTNHELYNEVMQKREVKRILRGLNIGILRGEAFDFRISREDAERLLVADAEGESLLPASVSIWCKEYDSDCGFSFGDDDDDEGDTCAEDWVQVYGEDIADDLRLAEHWQTFELSIDFESK